MKVRLFFATDVHGSEVCWRKFINSAKHYEADVLILGGDMTGKAVVPIVDSARGTIATPCRTSVTCCKATTSWPATSASSATTATIRW